MIVGLPRTTKLSDNLDIDDDGDRTEQVLYTESSVNYIPPLELIYTKHVGKDKTNFNLSTNVELGSPVYYRMNIYNNTIGRVSGTHIIDVLPYKGDHTIVSNDDGKYLERGSVFETPLIGSIEFVPENVSTMRCFDVSYQLSGQGADIDSVICLWMWWVFG